MAMQHILIVDDEADLRDTLKDLLELLGFSVITAANGREALKLMQESGIPCLILLDLMMPVMNGWEFLAALKIKYADGFSALPIVVISAAIDVADVQQQYGIRAMKKPLDIKRLNTLASEYCRI